jgi:AcrR family transcriptional regulator
VATKKRVQQREPHQLPAGRHGLSREFVVNNQRDRILNAVANVASVAGYSAMSVEDIIATAGVSRRTFYDHFKSKDDAFLAEYDIIASKLLSAVMAAYDPNASLPDRAQTCLEAVIDYFSAEPAYADMCIVEVLAAGPVAIERRDNSLQALAALIDQAADELPKRGRPPAITSQAVVGGIYEVIYSRVLRGKLEELPALVPDLIYSLLLPYLGIEVAAAAQKKARKRTRKAASAA